MTKKEANKRKSDAIADVNKFIKIRSDDPFIYELLEGYRDEIRSMEPIENIDFELYEDYFRKFVVFMETFRSFEEKPMVIVRSVQSLSGLVEDELIAALISGNLYMLSEDEAREEQIRQLQNKRDFLQKKLDIFKKLLAASSHDADAIPDDSEEYDFLDADVIPDDSEEYDFLDADAIPDDSEEYDFLDADAIPDDSEEYDFIDVDAITALFSGDFD